MGSIRVFHEEQAGTPSCCVRLQCLAESDKILQIWGCSWRGWAQGKPSAAKRSTRKAS